MSIKPEHEFIAIEGNIGAGKTSLARMFSRDFGAKLILEEFDDNSFLPKFYEHKARYAFPLEMSFLASRFNQLKKQLIEPDLFQQTIISDYIFAKCMLFSKINLDDDEYDLYLKLFEIINMQIRQPDLLVYLHNPIEKLTWNILNRGRSYEKNMSEEYLKQLSDAYLSYLHANTDLRILLVDCSSVDFVNNPNHYQSLLQLVKNKYTKGIHHISFLEE